MKNRPVSRLGIPWLRVPPDYQLSWYGLRNGLPGFLQREFGQTHYNDVIMGATASQTTSFTNVYSTVYSGADQRKHQSSASLAFVWEKASNAENVSIWWRHHMRAMSVSWNDNTPRYFARSHTAILISWCGPINENVFEIINSFKFGGMGGMSDFAISTVYADEHRHQQT